MSYYRRLLVTISVTMTTLGNFGCQSDSNAKDSGQDAGPNLDVRKSTEKESDSGEESACATDVFQVDAPSLEDNLVNAPTTQKAKILLPPNYDGESTTRYPVVYHVHGFSSNYQYDEGLFTWASDEMAAGRINDFIIVCVNSSTKLGGSFGVNSPVTGNWEDHITKEVISYVDNNYRTIPKKESRGISGLSMGGFVALNLGLRHPDIYNLVFAASPGVLNDEDIEAAFDQWRSYNSFNSAYGASFAYNLDLPYPHAEIPTFDGSEADNIIIEKWLDGFGNFDKKIEAYLEGDERLKSIVLNFGSNDDFEWIPRGCRSLSDLLTEYDIPNLEFEFIGEHSLYESQVKTRLLPYFSENLEYE